MTSRCAGLYCGRILSANGTWSDCGKCPRGFRVNENYTCELCTKEASSYSWMYMGFMAILPLMLHWFCVDIIVKTRKFVRHQLICYCSAIVEVFVSAVMSILLMKPKWTFDLETCGVEALSDWYSLFYDPAPNYTTKMQCAQEAVYPLQTIIIVFYLNCLISMIVIRSVVGSIFGINVKSHLYAGLYFLPILTIIHTLGSGLIYYAFPYLSILMSMVANAVHYSSRLDQSFKSLIWSSISETKNLIILGSNCSLLAYGVISLHRHYALLGLMVFPVLFYIATVRFTDPQEFRGGDEVH